MAGTSLNSSPSRDCVVMLKTSSPLTSLLFRPQGEILDPSHSFGMTIRSPAIATHSPTGEDKGGGVIYFRGRSTPILFFPHQRGREKYTRPSIPISLALKPRHSFIPKKLETRYSKLYFTPGSAPDEIKRSLCVAPPTRASPDKPLMSPRPSARRETPDACARRLHKAL